MGSIPGLGRSTGEGNGNSLQCSCLGNLMDRGAWQAAVHGVEKESDMTQWLNNNNHCHRVSESPASPTARMSVCRLADFFDSPSDAILFTQFIHQITEAEAREEIRLAVYYLFFTSTSLIYGKNKQVRRSSMWSKDVKGVPGMEMRRALGCLV